jgi:hypothetical protein
MKIKNLTQVWICSPNRTNVKGEFTTVWTYIGTEFWNLQQDLNELDRNQMGEVDYSIYKARTDKLTIVGRHLATFVYEDFPLNENYYLPDGFDSITNSGLGDGVYLNDVSSLTNPTPDYTVKNINQIGNTTVITLTQYKGD